MTDESEPATPAAETPEQLRLAVEDRERVAEVAADLVAIHVYRELRIRNKGSEVAGCSIIGNCSNGSCDIIGNCSSSSKSELLKEFQR
ncbi:MAG TPA: hypothetical protein VIT45_17235 [Allosphingosinicella sp.]